MTIYLVPCGRGRWNVLTMHIDGYHLAPFVVEVGAIWVLGHAKFRIKEVLP